MIRDHLATDITRIVEISFLLIGGISGVCEVIARLIFAPKFPIRDGLYHELRKRSALPSCIALSYRPTTAYQAPVCQTLSAGEYRYIYLSSHTYTIFRENALFVSSPLSRIPECRASICHVLNGNWILRTRCLPRYALPIYSMHSCYTRETLLRALIDSPLYFLSPPLYRR